MNIYQVSPNPISSDEVIAQLADPAVGGIATFVGVVRGVTGKRETLYLEYEAYPEMAEGVLAQVGQEVQERWPEIRQVIVIHRTGRLEIGGHVGEDRSRILSTVQDRVLPVRHVWIVVDEHAHMVLVAIRVCEHDDLSHEIDRRFRAHAAEDTGCLLRVTHTF